MSKAFSLCGKEVVITGGAGGIGFSIAKECLSRGASTVLLADKAAESLEAAEKNLHKLAPEAKIATYCADLTNESKRIAFQDAILEQHIQPFFLVNCLGSTFNKPFHEGIWPEMLQVLELNMHCMVHLCHLLIPGMIARGEGAILNMSSTSSRIPCPGLLCYSATKAFINNFSETLAIELKRHGIQVKYACPGATDTGFFAAAGMDGLDYVRKVHKMSPDDVARDCLDLMTKGHPGAVIGLKNKLNMLLASLMPWRVLHALTSRRFK